ncbi:MAG TPA: glycosyltransferase [Solirubrobacterales bacterium]|jgi:phosphatidylinositol alpha-mannosyltransferase|nr:glycosyltransferase [Solirubrobacterales bacterium]
MRIAIVSPYSWTYPGGVNRHVEALTESLFERGHEVRVMAPWDPPDRISRLLHRAPAEPRERPDYLIPLGRTVGVGANGAVSNLGVFHYGVNTMRRELRAGGFDVVHVHSPEAPALAWDACSFRGAPVVGTFHSYSTKAVPNWIANGLGARRKFNQLHARIAVSEAAAWTGRRWFGGTYRVIPNGVDIDAPPKGPKSPSEELRVLFVGRSEERKGLPVLLQAFEGLVEHVPARLTVIGSTREDVRRYLADESVEERIDARGRINGSELWHTLHEADVLCAPSLAGESFGMVLTEAFAAGTPVVASEIAGYSDVVTESVDGILVPPADPQRLAEELQGLYLEPDRRARMGAAARRSAERYAWPTVAAQVEQVYEHTQLASRPAVGLERIARVSGFIPIDGSEATPAARLPSLDPEPARAVARHGLARRLALGAASVLGLGLTALAANKIGLQNVVASIVRSDPSLVLMALGLMMGSMMLRAGSWYAIARAALPYSPLRRRDVTSATMIGVLMSATLPARLGEPARAMVLARRTGRMRFTFPVLLGTLVSQTVLNIAALVLLGVVIVASTDLFHSASTKLFAFSLVPLLLLLAVILAPVVVRRPRGAGRLARIAEAIRTALLRVRKGLTVFRDPRYGSIAATTQLSAWAVQLFACALLFKALGMHGVGIGAAAAVLFAVNVTAVVPATPSNIGVFQLAVISVLTTGFGVGAADALAYGVILQAVEVATAVVLGLPALVREGMTWSDMRLRALSTAPVRLSPRKPAGAQGTEST